MSWEEDYLMGAVRELKARVTALEAACPGISSETSPESSDESEKTNEGDGQPPAQTTESRSGRGRRASSTAPSTAGETTDL